MPKENILDKKIALAQKMNRLKEQDAKLKEQERKSRNRKVFELGGLVLKAKLENLPSNQIYGAFLEIADQAKDETILKRWEQKGGAVFNEEAKEKGQPIAVTFNEKPSLEVRKKIRHLGLRWNSFREEWQGIFKVEDIQQAINDLGGILHVVKLSRKDK